jgi:hypothetical protein
MCSPRPASVRPEKCEDGRPLDSQQQETAYSKTSRINHHGIALQQGCGSSQGGEGRCPVSVRLEKKCGLVTCLGMLSYRGQARDAALAMANDTVSRFTGRGQAKYGYMAARLLGQANCDYIIAPSKSAQGRQDHRYKPPGPTKMSIGESHWIPSE